MRLYAHVFGRPSGVIQSVFCSSNSNPKAAYQRHLGEYLKHANAQAYSQKFLFNSFQDEVQTSHILFKMPDGSSRQPKLESILHSSGSQTLLYFRTTWEAFRTSDAQAVACTNQSIITGCLKPCDSNVQKAQEPLVYRSITQWALESNEALDLDDRFICHPCTGLITI